MMTRTAEISATPKMTAKDLATFVAQIPEYAEITFREERGDPRDIREAGYRKTTIKATWKKGER